VLQRVYDEEVTNSSEPKAAQDAEMTHHQLEAVLIPKYTDAIRSGLQALEISKQLNYDRDDDFVESEESRKNRERLVRSFIIHHSSFIIHHSSFIIHHSSFIIHH